MTEATKKLLEAAQRGDLTAVKALLADPQVEINGADGDGNTAMLLAAREGHAEVANTLLTAGADLELTNHVGDDARSAALHQGHIKLSGALAPPKQSTSSASVWATPLLWLIDPLAWLFTDPFAISMPGRLPAILGVILAAVGLSQGISISGETVPVGAAMLAIGIVLFFVGYAVGRDKDS